MKPGQRIIDIHTHAQPPQVISGRVCYTAAEPDFRLLYEDPDSRLAGSEDVLAYMDAGGIDKSVILGFAWRNPETLRIHNDMILSDAAANTERFFGFTCVYPFSGDASGEARRCLKAGAAGIGEVGLYDRDIDAEYIDAMAPVMKACREYERPLMLHVNEPIGHSYDGKAPNTISGIYNFIKRYPDNRIILAHWGGGLFFFSLLKKEVKAALKNVWFDSAASPYLYDPRIWKAAAETVGIEKILFGTDFPLLGAERYMAELEQAGFSDDELDLILYRNAMAVLGYKN